MGNAPKFFIPDVSEAEQESRYAEYAKICGRQLPEASKRIFSIRYRHIDDEWVATVGDRLTGTRYATNIFRGQWAPQRKALSDSALVQAIFPGAPGVPYVVVTDGGVNANSRSHWKFPYFFAHEPRRVEYFST
jgi:hypothetical protein